MDKKGEALTVRYPTIHDSVTILAAVTGKSQTVEERGMRPSEYAKQMSMGVQERIDYLLKPGRTLNARSLYDDAESRCFAASPGIVLFQRFLPGNVYRATLAIRNTTRVSRRLRISSDPDPFFALECHGSNRGGTAVAPGLVHAYNVRFSPAEKRDYEYRIRFVDDDDDVLAVPVIAIGPRPILDIPDRIVIPPTAVKIAASKTILVRNLGDAPAIFSFRADSPCFSVEPSRGILKEEETMQLTATFLSEKSGDFEARLHLNYESGEKLFLALHSSSINSEIRIDKSTIRMKDTYLGLSRSETLTIHNGSDYVVRFQWMQFKDKDADEQRKEEYKGLFRLVHNVEVVRHVGLVHYNICVPDVHELVCQRIYADEVASLMNENFRYNHTSFLLTPEEGEIWPRSSADITVIFRATEVGEVSSVAYLEVTGREDRIPLSLHGTGKGPVLRLNVITIDLKDVYLCSVHNYEVVATNEGHICGTLVYDARPTNFGGTIDVTPPDLTLNPDECKSFNLSFSSNQKGNFVERIDFVIKESLEVLSLHIRGCVVCPALHFDKNSLDFGTIALGFSRREEVCLCNLSVVAVSYSVIVMEDGDQTPLTHEEFAKSSEEKPSFPANPREFAVTPQKGVVQACSSLKLKIVYTANVARIGRSAVRVDVWDSDSDPVILPITFCGAIPSLSIKPAEIPIRFSFIDVPYYRSIDVVNDSDLDGYFYITPQAISKDIPTVYSISCYQGLLGARQSRTIDVTVIARILGRQQVTLNMLTMGEQAPVTSCTIICNGKGPVISVRPTCLDFGKVQVLREEIASFRIINDSPIPARYELTSDKKNSSWLAEPTAGELEPNEFTVIEVKILLRDAGRYTDAINVQVLNGRSVRINVIAIGIGCSIVFEPQIFPTFDMGLLFSCQNHSLPITIRNLGTHHYQVVWSNDPEVRAQRSQTSHTFQIEPTAVEIPANGVIVVQCKMYWNTNETVMENWYIFGQIHGKGKRELLGSSTFKATFTEPQVIFNKRKLTFRIDICSNAEELLDTDELVVTNQSRLRLNVLLYVDTPFYLTNNEDKFVREKKIVLMDGSATTIPVRFSPSIDPDDPYSRDYNGTLWCEYDGNPNREKIRCQGAVNFPNIALRCKDLIINCVSGSSAEGTLELTNNGPIPVMYKFLWAGESIEIQRDARDVEITSRDTDDFVNQVELPTDVEGCELCSCSYEDREDSEDHGNDYASIKTLCSSSSLLCRLQKVRSEDSLMKIRSPVLSGSCYKLSDIFLPIEDASCLLLVEDSAILTSTDSNHEITARESLDDILDIVPHEGIVPPYSSQSVRFIFHGSEPMRVKAVALCEILRGPTEIVNVTARADVVRYSVDRQVIDFDQQLFGELCRSSFTLENRSAIHLDYKINEKNLICNAGKSGPAISALKIEPDKRGSVEPLSPMKIEIEFQPILLGPFEIEFELQVACLTPLTITTKGVTSYPQIYPCTPRRDTFERHPTELGYRAIQLLTSDYIATKREMRMQCNGTGDGDKCRVPECDANILLSDLWELISYEEIFPTVIDIEMAIDRYLVARFVHENVSILIKHLASQEKSVIPFPRIPDYIIDMGYITIGLKTFCSARIINYGPWNAETVVKRLDKRRLENSGILVQLKKAQLKVGEAAPLTITWQPTSAKHAERTKEERHSIHLEVYRGCTVPITIRGNVTYPFVIVNTELLNFQDVLVGECLMMCVLVKNEGFVLCRWQTRITTTRKKHADCPFHLNYKSNSLLPDRSDVINVYFKPRKACYASAKLIIAVEMGLETQTVTLHGRGVECKLRISDSDINFPPTVPFTKIQEKVFTIENVCDYPVEFFWHHLDSLFLEEERAAEALIRYYGVKEILLPPRKLGQKIPSFLMEFYNGLMSEMAHALSARAIEQESVATPNGGHGTRANARKKSSSSNRSTSRSLDRRSTTRGGSKVDPRREVNIGGSKREKPVGYPATSFDSPRGDRPLASICSQLDLPHEPPLPSTSDPEEMQNLLLRYIEALRQDPSSHERMRDPVRDLFDSLEATSIPELAPVDSSRPAKKVCIIFHGAPFTEYQETACKSAKVLRVPLLHVDNAIIEGVAFGDGWSSVKLREIIDEAYERYTSVLENYRESSEVEQTTTTTRVDADDTLRDRETIAREKSPIRSRSPGAIKARTKPMAEVDRNSGNDARELIIRLEEELARIPRRIDLKSLDPVSLYECKIQAIALLREIFPRYTTVGLTTDRVSEKSAEGSRNDTFLGVEIDLLIEVLRERLSSADFKSGFVLQTLNNAFFKSEITTLLALFATVGHVEYSLFVTFLNTMDAYVRKMEELRELEARRLAEETNKKIQEIDEMSLSEYELLPEDERKLYLESTLPIKKQEALQRRAQFVQRMTELRRGEKLSRQSSNAGTTKNRKGNKIIKPGKTDNHEDKFQTFKMSIDKKEIRDRKEPKAEDDSKAGKQEMSKELENIAKAMNDYYSNLSAIENIIKNWDPLTKDLGPFTATNKISKNDKAKDQNSDISKEQTRASKFHIWYVNATDPWKRTMYDVVVKQLSEDSFVKKALPVEISPEPDLEPKRYYVLRPRENVRKRDTGSNGVFQMVALSTTSNAAIATIDPPDAMIDDRRENRARRKRRLRVTARTDDTASLNASTIESGESNAILEDIPKPRWILRPYESQRFKIRYRPEETGTHRDAYAISVVDGDGIARNVNVRGIADVPRLDTDPRSIFSKVEETKVDDVNDPAYLTDAGAYDFGSLLMLRRDKSAHRRETVFKFRNVSNVDAEVYFYLQENIPDIFVVELEKLYIPSGQCRSLNVSAGVTRLGAFADKLHICVANNPRVHTIELRCNGAKLDVELDDKQLSFGRVLLYRRDCLARTMRNRSPARLFWRATSDEPLDPQISFAPINGVVNAWSDQKIEFCYRASKIGKIETSLTFEIFLRENDPESVSTETLVLSGETYDVAVDINHANPIDLKPTMVGFPTSARFTIGNRGNYEVRYVILVEEQDRSSKIAPSSLVKLKEDIEIQPTSGSIQPQKEAIVQITFLPTNEIALKECPILRCRLLDANKQTVVVAEIPLTVSLIAYYNRFRVYPYPEVDFASLGVYTKRTMHLSVENIGQFPLRYSIHAAPIEDRSLVQSTGLGREGVIKQDPTEASSSVRRDKKSSRVEKSSARQTPEPRSTLKVGPFVITKTEGDVRPGEIDIVTVECCPEFTGPQQRERIIILAPGSPPEEKNGKLITLSVNSCVPGVDFQDPDAMFRDSYIVDRIEDFVCPKGIGAHTVFARREKCLHFRYVGLSRSHTTSLVLHNRNAIPADVELILPSESLAPVTVKPDVFVVTPRKENIPPTSRKEFVISFNPTIMETCRAMLEVTVELPPRLKNGKFSVKLAGQACVPEVRMVEPSNGERERAVVNFGRTLVNVSRGRTFAFQNVGVIPAEVTIEIHEDPNFLFTLDTRDDKKSSLNERDYEADVPGDRCAVVRLMSGETALFGIKFVPREIGEFEGQVRLFVADNPNKDRTIDLRGAAYTELIVLEGLELVDIFIDDSVNEKQESDSRTLRRPSSGSNGTVKDPTTFPISLIYRLDYGRCFVNEVYRRNFKIVNRSTDRHLRFQWSAHPDVAFTPSVGHLKPLTHKKIVATFLSSEPTSHVDVNLDCEISAIELLAESNWDDREQEVRWVAIDSDIASYDTNARTFVRKAVEAVNEPSHEIVPSTTKCIKVLLNAIVTYPEHSCLVKEISFEDALMFQVDTP